MAVALGSPRRVGAVVPCRDARRCSPAGPGRRLSRAGRACLPRRRGEALARPRSRLGAGNCGTHGLPRAGPAQLPPWYSRAPDALARRIAVARSQLGRRGLYRDACCCNATLLRHVRLSYCGQCGLCDQRCDRCGQCDRSDRVTEQAGRPRRGGLGYHLGAASCRRSDGQLPEAGTIQRWTEADTPAHKHTHEHTIMKTKQASKRS
jgi:hypothetical protein